MKKLTAIPALCVLLGSLFAAIPANTQPITGTWVTGVYRGVDTEVGTLPAGPTSGAILFGNLPTPGLLVTETATSSTSWGGGALPIPTYSDATPADPSEVFWTMQIQIDGPDFVLSSFAVEIQYTGGTVATLSSVPNFLVPFGGCADPLATIPSIPFNFCATVTAVAIRTQAPVAVSEQTWGKTKNDYK